MGGYFKHHIDQDPELNDATAWTVNAPWIVAGGKATINGSQGAEVLLQKNALLEAAVPHEVYVNVPVLTAGTLTIRLGATALTAITAPGTYLLSGTPATNTNFIIAADAELVCEILQIMVTPYQPL